jgi:hypothetical protein
MINNIDSFNAEFLQKTKTEIALKTPKEKRGRGRPRKNALDTPKTNDLTSCHTITQAKAESGFKEPSVKWESVPLPIPTTEIVENVPIEDSKANVLVDCLEFKSGENILKINLYKKHNRMFRIQIFLNESTEIRPSTYAGGNPALCYWKLLKNSLKK